MQQRFKRAMAIVATAVALESCAVQSYTPPPSAFRDARTTIDPGTAAELQTILDVAVNVNEMPGIQAAVILRDGTAWVSAAGTTDFSRRDPLLTTSLMRIASISKLYTAVLVMRAIERGELSLDDPLSRWLPDYPRADEITIRMMLAHTSGLPDTFEEFRTLLRSGFRRHYVWTAEELVAAHDGELYFEPGTAYRYSNANYIFLGIVLEGATGIPVEASIRRDILQPIGLNDTWFPPVDIVADRLVSGFDRDLMPYPTEHRADQTSWSSLAWTSGALVASAYDVAAFTRAVFTGDAVTRRSLDLMLEFGPAPDAGEAWTGYGLGVARVEIGGREYWGHEGLFIGFEGFTLHDPDRQMQIVVLGNKSTFAIEEVVAALAQAID
jgi:D-alanyl-D-alanine carboxypeptidase